MFLVAFLHQRCRRSGDFPSEEFRSCQFCSPPPASSAAYAWRVLADVACNDADGAHSRAERRRRWLKLAEITFSLPPSLLL